jgi:hypothetical protein
MVGKKLFARFILNGKYLVVVAYTPVFPAIHQKPKTGGSWPGWPMQKAPISKINRAMKAGGMTQSLEHQPNKCKALSSTPSTAKKRKLKSQYCQKYVKINVFVCECKN